jgi:hypothetical protein
LGQAFSCRPDGVDRSKLPPEAAEKIVFRLPEESADDLARLYLRLKKWK